MHFPIRIDHSGHSVCSCWMHLFSKQDAGGRKGSLAAVPSGSSIAAGVFQSAAGAPCMVMSPGSNSPSTLKEAPRALHDHNLSPTSTGIMEKKLRACIQARNFCCFMSLFRILSAKSFGNSTFSIGPNAMTRITSSVSSSAS